MSRIQARSNRTIITGRLESCKERARGERFVLPAGMHGFHGSHAAIDSAKILTAKHAHACPHFILRSMRWIRANAQADSRKPLLSMRPASSVQPSDPGGHQSGLRAARSFKRVRRPRFEGRGASAGDRSRRRLPRRWHQPIRRWQLADGLPSSPSMCHLRSFSEGGTQMEVPSSRSTCHLRSAVAIFERVASVPPLESSHPQRRVDHGQS
jgi:hypothetical protein